MKKLNILKMLFPDIKAIIREICYNFDDKITIKSDEAQTYGLDVNSQKRLDSLIENISYKMKKSYQEGILDESKITSFLEGTELINSLKKHYIEFISDYFCTSFINYRAQFILDVLKSIDSEPSNRYRFITEFMPTELIFFINDWYENKIKVYKEEYIPFLINTVIDAIFGINQTE